MNTNAPTQMLRFIKDEAASEDSFKSHTRLATAIARIIQTQNDLKVIGLLGAWGSGKSTVIKLVEGQLEQAQDKKTYCFCYDAWLHQNDPPRRSFLETLIYFLIDKKLTTEARWKESLKQLNKQVEDTEVISTPTLTVAGRFIILSLFLLPLGTQFVNYQWFNAAFTTNPSFAAIIAISLGIFCLTLPALIALGVYIAWRPTKNPFTRKFWHKKNWLEHKEGHEHESIISLFMNKEVQKRRNKITRSPDPTTIEFQDIFREIMHTVSANDKRFLFVIDNLDRLPEAEALTIWATIRSFFLGAQETNYVRKATNLPTVILPIDEEAIKRMYQVTHKDSKDKLAKSFMDKTFDLTFRVSRPVLSDWNEYLAQQMHYVFGEKVPQNWIYLVGRLYERFITGKSSAIITPRIINTLINLIGTLWLQWEEENIEFVTVAYYAIYRESIDKNIFSALSNSEAGIEDLDPNWQRSIAAIHYGVKPEQALQILIEQPIKKAISERDIEEFKKLTVVSAFDRVFQRVLDREVSANPVDFSFIFNAVLLLKHLNPPIEPWVETAWRTLRQGYLKTPPAKSLDEEHLKLLDTLLETCPNLEIRQFLPLTTSKISTLDSALMESGSFSKSFVNAAQKLFDFCELHEIPQNKITIPGNAKACLAVLEDGLEKSVLPMLETNIAPQDLINELAKHLSEQALSATVELKMRAFIKRGYEASWDPLINSAVQVLQSQNDSYPGMSSALVVLGLLRQKHDTVKTHIKGLVDGNTLAVRFHEGYNANKMDIAVRAIALLMLTTPNFSAPNDKSWEAIIVEQPTLPALINDALTEFGGQDNLSELVELAGQNSAILPLVRALVSLRVKERKLGSIDVESTIINFTQYLNCIYDEDELEKILIQQFANYDTFWEHLAKAPFESNKISILTVLLNPSDFKHDYEAAQNMTAECLESTASDKWELALKKGGGLLSIAEAYIKSSKKPLHLGSQLFDVLQKEIPELFANADEKFRKQWLILVALLSDNARKTLLKNVRDQMNSGVQFAELHNLFKLFSVDFLQQAEFVSRPDDSVRHVIIPLLRNLEGINCLIEKAIICKSWIAGSDRSTKSFLIERMSESWGSKSDQEKANLTKLQTEWGLPTILSDNTKKGVE